MPRACFKQERAGAFQKAGQFQEVRGGNISVKNGIIYKFSYCVLAAAAALQLANAQGTINYGSIGGQVSDATGAVVLGAAVTARQIDTNRISSLTTDREGRFRFPYLSAGLRSQDSATWVHNRRAAVTLSVGSRSNCRSH